MITLWRKKMYEQLRGYKLHGEVLDIGGARHSSYYKVLSGDYNLTVVNIDHNYEHDLKFNLEEKFPLEDNKYDTIICFNVLEHIFNYQNVVDESLRTLKLGGTLLLAVPFLIQIHPCPNDYWRFSKQALEKILTRAGFKDIKIETIGTGVFGSSYQLKYNIYKFSIVRIIMRYLAIFFDKIISLLKKDSFAGKKYYPLGYFVTAKKYDTE